MSLIESHLTGRGFSLGIGNVHASIWKPPTSWSLFPVTNKRFVSTKGRCIYEICYFPSRYVCYLHLQFINKWFSLPVIYQQEAGMLPCPQRPWACPRWEMTGGIWVFSAPQVAKLVKFKCSSFIAAICFFKLLHKSLLSNSFQQLRTPLNEPNTKLRERKFN